MDEIFEAVIFGNMDALKRLLAAGADIDTQDRDKRTLLTNAVLSEQKEITEFLIDKGANIDAQDYAGFTALHYAAQDHLMDIARVLLENKAKVDIQDKYGNTPLSRAISRPDRKIGEMIKLLLSFGADRNRKNNYGVSPLSLSQTIGNYDVAQFFDD